MMKNVFKSVGGKSLIVASLVFAASALGFSQKKDTQKPSTTIQNLLRGVMGPVSSNNSWANYSVFNTIPGSALFPITSSTTVFYLGFTAGSEADISNMVLYTTAHGSLTITAVTPVTLGGVSNPSVILDSTSVCPTQPLSTTSPCIVRLDPTSISLTPSSDYHLAIYFTDDDNNGSVGATQAGSIYQSSFVGTYYGGNYSNLTVGESIPSASNATPDFLMYVMNN
jgi:hypothetical protein